MVDKISYNNILTLREKVEKLLSEDELLKGNPNITVLKNILKLIVNEEAFHAYYQEFNDVLLSMADMDFSKRLSIENSGDLFSYISTAINLLNEELAEKAAPKHLLQQTLDLLAEAAILLDKDKVIQYVNHKFGQLTGFESNEVMGHPISLLFPPNYAKDRLKGLIVGDIAIIYTKRSDFTFKGIKLAMQPLITGNEISGYAITMKELEDADFPIPSRG